MVTTRVEGVSFLFLTKRYALDMVRLTIIFLVFVGLTYIFGHAGKGMEQALSLIFFALFFLAYRSGGKWARIELSPEGYEKMSRRWKESIVPSTVMSGLIGGIASMLFGSIPLLFGESVITISLAIIMGSWLYYLFGFLAGMNRDMVWGDVPGSRSYSSP